ncbi:homeodomain-like superfamily protein [Striga asiatica]|uniref:Homeodomain-like superfamily protein n=1 Tax=Striga asiatica TaxID=4170 RepID=A0A5A7Q998_STRAF|nr:homeodomain-like superfamily protein [Striga asiatica]
MDLTVVNQGGATSSAAAHNNNAVLRDYRKGNWNLQETMILIEAKRMDDERRMRRLGESPGGGERGKPAELRWKWVEDYCWRKGCLRSQNQCNDKWDNLMRDFKKVREYERRAAESPEGGTADGNRRSYWRIEKTERKDNNLPSNMLPQVYEALVDVVERKGLRPPPTEKGGVFLLPVVSPPTQQQHSVGYHAPAIGPAAAAAAETPSFQPLPTVDSDTSDYSGSPAKRRKRPGGGAAAAGEGTSGGTIQELGSAISKSASVIAGAIQSCEEREERRHREMMSIHERRLRIEESKAEINRQGINGLVDSINKLANSIFALAAQNNAQPPPK